MTRLTTTVLPIALIGLLDGTLHRVFRRHGVSRLD